jgi:hypothetical protein
MVSFFLGALIDLVLNTQIGQVVMVFQCNEGMPQGQNVFVYQIQPPKLMNAFCKSSNSHL